MRYEKLYKAVLKSLTRREEEIKHLKEENLDLRRQLIEIKKTFHTRPSDRWLIDYYLDEMIRSKRLLESQMDVISQYQAHFDRFKVIYNSVKFD